MLLVNYSCSLKCIEKNLVNYSYFGSCPKFEAIAGVDAGKKVLVASNDHGVHVSTLMETINSRREENCIESKGRRRVGGVHFEDGHHWTSHHISWMEVEGG